MLKRTLADLLLVMDIRKRFINSIEYLRKLGFFEEYSNLTS